MIYHVFANRSNIGDWLSALGIQSQLGGRAVRELLCDESFVGDTLDALDAAGAGDLVLIGGGGLLMDYFEPFWSGIASLTPSVPYIIWGVGLCDMKSRNSRPIDSLARAVIHRSRLCVVRDRLTRDAFADLNLPEPVPCPSLLELNRSIRKKSAVLFAVHYEATGESGYELLAQLIRQFAANHGRQYLETNNEVLPDNRRSLNGVLSLYDESEMVISSRLHGCIIGLAAGCKVLALSGDRKLESFMQSAGLAEWVCDVQDYKSVRARLDRLHEQPERAEFLAKSRRENALVGAHICQILDSVEQEDLSVI